MIRRLIARIATAANEPHGGNYCETCGWWTKPHCGH